MFPGRLKRLKVLVEVVESGHQEAVLKAVADVAVGQPGVAAATEDAHVVFAGQDLGDPLGVELGSTPGFRWESMQDEEDAHSTSMVGITFRRGNDARFELRPGTIATGFHSQSARSAADDADGSDHGVGMVDEERGPVRTRGEESPAVHRPVAQSADSS